MRNLGSSPLNSPTLTLRTRIVLQACCPGPNLAHPLLPGLTTTHAQGTGKRREVSASSCATSAPHPSSSPTLTPSLGRHRSSPTPSQCPRARPIALPSGRRRKVCRHSLASPSVLMCNSLCPCLCSSWRLSLRGFVLPHHVSPLSLHHLRRCTHARFMQREQSAAPNTCMHLILTKPSN